MLKYYKQSRTESAFGFPRRGLASAVVVDACTPAKTNGLVAVRAARKVLPAQQALVPSVGKLTHRLWRLERKSHTLVRDKK